MAKDVEMENVESDDKTKEDTKSGGQEGSKKDKTAVKDESKETEESNDAQDQSGSSGEEDSGEDAAEPAEPLATTRSRRTNAGNRMSKMIQDEEDEFYANLYGGFNEEEDDIDFDSDDENDYDSFESDFSIDEADDIAPEHQMVEEEPKRRSRAYKDPKPKGYSTAQSGPSSVSGPTASTPIQPRPKPSSSGATLSPGKIRGERSFRDSTRKKTEETIKNIQHGKRKKKKKIRNMEAWRPLTQEEMLQEAKQTEEENLKSLEMYQRLELEKLKKIKQPNQTLPAPYVTYLSTTMPILGTKEKYTRNFMTYVT